MQNQDKQQLNNAETSKKDMEFKSDMKAALGETLLKVLHEHQTWDEYVDQVYASYLKSYADVVKCKGEKELTPWEEYVLEVYERSLTEQDQEEESEE